ncbi:MAG: VWA domain-containing protein, partial [Alphaproteobacteria bacterium]|nr:VWA domain-containing protein [Alphaproteobacteria bacterium]
MRVSTFLTSAFAALLISAPNFATAADKAVLVLDGSGSMWGQVGDTTKIEIARDVISDLMLDWSDKVELGLSAYGHREKGNCSDIETLKPIGPVDPKEVAQIVEAITPKGKTPLTAAVRNAADELRYEEDRATVILVSDGEETCGGDPCAVARDLEASGIDFTVHVVGFDLTDEETTNLKCIADNTGGKFLRAGNAEELHQALAAVKEVVVEGVASSKEKILFAETFDDDAKHGSALNFEAFDQFGIESGSVDIIRSGDYEIECVGNQGGCVDLDGSTQGADPTVLFTTRKIAFERGIEYTLDFAISGNQRGYPEDRVDVLIGDDLTGTTGPFSSDDAFNIYSMTFMVDE